MITIDGSQGEALDKIVARKKGSTEKLSARVGKILARYMMGKFVEWQIETGRLKWPERTGRTGIPAVPSDLSVCH